MRNKRKLLYGIIPVLMMFSAFCRFSLMFPALHMKKNRIVFSPSCAFKAAKAQERIWETVVRTFLLCQGRPCVQIIRRFSF